MPSKTTPTRKQIIQQVLAELDGPAPIKVVVDRVAQRRPSQAKDPRKAIRTDLMMNHTGRDCVLIDAKTILPTRLALQGVRFRIRLDRREVQRGLLFTWPGFSHFLREPYERASFVDTDDASLPTRLVKIPVKISDFLLGNTSIEVSAFDLGDWFTVNRIRRNDDVLVTILDWETARFRLEHEPAQRRRKDLIARQNRALAEVLYDLMEATHDERLYLYVGVPTAYARLPSARDYPGDHWLSVVDRDERMRVTDVAIMPADQLLPLEAMLMDPTETMVREQPFTSQQGNQVYRFKATSRYRKRDRVVELQGKHTLKDFDDMMRDGFDLDFTDHLSEFTRIIPRGKGKRPREIPCGELNPFEKTAAAKVRVAGLGLEPGAQLLYVYDFGDWLEHHLTLEGIVPREPGATYPRLAPVGPFKRKRRQSDEDD